MKKITSKTEQIIGIPLVLAGFYTILSMLWVVLSDELPTNFGWNLTPDQYELYQYYKDLVFVVFNGIVLFVALFLWSNEKEKIFRNFKSVFDNTPNPMFVYLIEDRKVVLFNEAARVFFEYDQFEPRSISLMDLLAKPERQRFEDYISNPTNAPNSAGRWLFTTRNGTEKTVEVYANAVNMFNQKARLVMLVDIEAILEEEHQNQLDLLRIVDFSNRTSHKVRKPLANLIALKSVFSENSANDDLFRLMSRQLEEMDRELGELNRVIDEYLSTKNFTEK